MFISPHECGLCTHDINSLIAPALYLGVVEKCPLSFKRTPPLQKFLGKGLCMHMFNVIVSS